MRSPASGVPILTIVRGRLHVAGNRFPPHDRCVSTLAKTSNVGPRLDTADCATQSFRDSPDKSQPRSCRLAVRGGRREGRRYDACQRARAFGVSAVCVRAARAEGEHGHVQAATDIRGRLPAAFTPGHRLRSWVSWGRTVASQHWQRYKVFGFISRRRAPIADEYRARVIGASRGSIHTCEQAVGAVAMGCQS
jgi:hypothetical protein